PSSRGRRTEKDGEGNAQEGGRVQQEDRPRTRNAARALRPALSRQLFSRGARTTRRDSRSSAFPAGGRIAVFASAARPSAKGLDPPERETRRDWGDTRSRSCPGGEPLRRATDRRSAVRPRQR